MREYWVDRFGREGDSYVALGGDPDSSDSQLEVLEPFLRSTIPPGGRVLDFGCGPGRFRPLIEEVSAEYVGVDLIPGLGTIELEEKLPTGFDCAVAVLVLQHIVDDQEYLDWVGQLHACLKPGSPLIVVDSGPLENPDSHMAPRELFGVMGAAPWLGAANSPAILNGHWCAIVETQPCEERAPFAPTFSDADGEVRVTSEMPEILEVSTELLSDPGRLLLSRAGDVVDIEVANGHWVYEIIGWRQRREIAVCRLQYSEIP